MPWGADGSLLGRGLRWGGGPVGLSLRGAVRLSWGARLSGGLRGGRGGQAGSVCCGCDVPAACLLAAELGWREDLSVFVLGRGAFGGEVPLGRGFLAQGRVGGGLAAGWPFGRLPFSAFPVREGCCVAGSLPF